MTAALLHDDRGREAARLGEGGSVLVHVGRQLGQP
jgi:hypothetical protein